MVVITTLIGQSVYSSEDQELSKMKEANGLIDESKSRDSCSFTNKFYIFFRTFIFPFIESILIREILQLYE